MQDSSEIGKLKNRIKELEEQLEQLKNTGSDSNAHEKITIALSAGKFAWWDMYLPSGRVEFNDQKVTMLGYDPSEFVDVTFHDFMTLVHPDDHEVSMEAMRQHLEGKKEFYDVEYRIKAKDGTYHWYYDRGAIVERDGQNITLRGIVIDITERNEAQSKLLEANRSLEAANAEKDLLLSIIAHDLNNPFMPILGFSNELKNQFSTLPDETKLKYAERIYDGANNLQELLQNLLSWGRSQRGTIQVTLQPLQLAPLVDSEIRQLTLNAEEKHITLSEEIPVECELQTDPDLLSVILRNLITNSLKFTDAGGSVTVSAVKSDGKCIIKVVDTGIGMPSQVLKNLYKFDREILRKGTGNEKGSGLGIKLCKNFADRIGGSLSFTSAVGEGTTAILTLSTDRPE